MTNQSLSDTSQAELLEELWFKFKTTVTRLAYVQGRGRLKRYGFAVILTLAVFFTVYTSQNLYLVFLQSQTLAFLLFTFVVTCASWFGGLGPGLFATLILVFANYFTFLGDDVLFHPRIGDVIVSLIFLVEGMIISLISEARFESDFQKDKFVALAAHEIKNPLTAILGFAGLMRRESIKSHNKKFAGYSERIESESAKMLEIINDMLDITRIEVGKFVYNDELFDFDNLVSEVILYQNMSNKRRINLHGSSKRIIKGDRYRVGQVVTNLLTNAIKYSPSEFPIEVKLKKVPGGVGLSVKDQGIGIAKKDLKNVFREFYRSGKTGKEKAQGLGLGLFLSSEIVKRHGGKLWVKSDGKRGSTFFLTFPRGY